MKPLALLLFVFTLLGLTVTAQEVRWFDEAWNSVPSKEKAAYYRVTESDTLNHRFFVKDYYKSGKVYRTGTFLSLVPEIRDGQFIWYFKNGRIHKEVTYQGNQVTNWRVLDEKGKVKLAVVVAFKGPNGEELAEAMPVDKEPAYQGGSRPLSAFIRKNLEYPPIASNEPLEGTVLVYFTVEENGRLTNLKIAQSLHPDMDKAALTLVAKMPPWVPATVNGIPVSVPYVLPVKFYNKSAQSFSRNNVAGSRGMMTY